MPTFTNNPVISDANSPTAPAITGESSKNEGVRGVSHDPHPPGVVGVNDWDPTALHVGGGANGGWFESAQGEGVRGWSKNFNHGGVVGVNTAGGFGTYGTRDEGIGGLGESKNNERGRGSRHGVHAGGVGVNDWGPPYHAGGGGEGALV